MFYRYTVNHLKGDVLKERKNQHKNNRNEFYRGKPKTPICFKEVRLDLKKGGREREKEKENWVDGSREWDKQEDREKEKEREYPNYHTIESHTRT